MNKLRILRWGDHPGLSGWAPYKGPFKRDAGGGESEGNVMMESEKELGRCNAAGFGDEGKDHMPTNAGKAGKVKETDSPLEFPEGS